jgi:bacterioferritin-associated ferredoxin
METLILIVMLIFAVATVARHINKLARGTGCFEQCGGCTGCKNNIDMKNS